MRKYREIVAEWNIDVETSKISRGRSREKRVQNSDSEKESEKGRESKKKGKMEDVRCMGGGRRLCSSTLSVERRNIL